METRNDSPTWRTKPPRERQILLEESDQGTILGSFFLAVGLLFAAFSLYSLIPSCKPRSVIRVERGAVSLPEVPALSRDGASFLVDVNSAGLYELCVLPGIGETMARKIIAYRKEHGPFQTADELLRVPGIGPKKLQTIEAMLAPIAGTEVFVNQSSSSRSTPPSPSAIPSSLSPPST